MSDLIHDTFVRWRDAARRHGSLPNLARQGRPVVPRRAIAARPAAQVPGLSLIGAPTNPTPRPTRGRATGMDGRALQKTMRVKSFSSLVGTEIKKRDWSENMAYGWVMGNWETLVGEKIAQHTTVRMIKDSEVHIECDTTAWATQMKYMQATVLRAISEKVGPDVVTKLHIYGPKAPSWRKGPLHVKGRGPRDTYG